MDLVAGESLAGLTEEVDKETEVEEGFGFAHLPLQHTCVHLVNKGSPSVYITCDCSGQALSRGSVLTFLPFPGGK